MFVGGNFYFFLGAGKMDSEKIGKFLGGGSEGEVYEYGRGRVIKLVYRGIRYEYSEAERIYSRVRRLGRVARIYSWGEIEEGEFQWYVEMERLRKIPDTYRRKINDCGSGVRGGDGVGSIF